jgi:isoleucyl-tRNA synthetase
VRRHEALLADRLNAYEIELVEPGQDWGELQYSAEADMSEFGPAFGDRAQEVMQACNDARIDEATLDALEDALGDVLEDGDQLTESMVSFVTQSPEGVTGSPIDRGGEERGVVYVDTTLTEEIEREGYAREVIRRVQQMRKDLELEMDARIELEYSIDDERVADFVAEKEDLIAEEVRAEQIGSVDDGHRETWDVEGVSLELAVAPLAEPSAQ